MKIRFFILALIIISCKKEEEVNLTLAEKNTHTFTAEERKREFIVYQPSGIDLNDKVPMVMVFHGTGGDGEKFYNISQWKELADKEKFYAVFPSALTYCVEENGVKEVTSKWNIYKLQEIACNSDRLVNDFDFVSKMIDSISKYYPVDIKKIYATGFSNGGAFTYQLGIELSNKIAAIAPAGVFLTSFGYKPKELISIYHILGAKDPLILEPLGIQKLPIDESLLTTSGAKFSHLAVCNTFQLDSTKYVFGPSKYGGSIFKWETPKNNGTNKNVYHWEVLSDLLHQYPNGSNHSMIAAEEIWKFFKDKSK